MKKQTKRRYFIELAGTEVLRLEVDEERGGAISFTDTVYGASEPDRETEISDIPSLCSQLRWIADELEKDFPQEEAE